MTEKTNPPCDWDEESYCCEENCTKPATHRKLEGMAGEIPVFEMICCEHAVGVDSSKVKIDEMTYETLIESGLLWYINHHALHPIGLALGVNIAEDKSAGCINVYVSDDGIWTFPDEINEIKQKAFSEWYKEKTDRKK